MTKIISIHSFRGGTGKSNLTANLATAVARTGRRVAVIDTDIQSPGIHVLFGLDENRLKYSLNDYLWGRCAIQDTAYDVSHVARNSTDGELPPFSLFLVPSSLKCGEIARILGEGYDVGLLNDGFRELIAALNLDYLFIDTHPGVNEETLMSIAVSDLLLLIMRPDNQDFQGTAVTVELARQLDVNRMLLLLNKVPPTRDPKALTTQVENIYQVPVAGLFPLSIDVASLASSGIFCVRYPQHAVAREIERVAGRIINE